MTDLLIAAVLLAMVARVAVAIWRNRPNDWLPDQNPGLTPAARRRETAYLEAKYAAPDAKHRYARGGER